MWCKLMIEFEKVYNFEVFDRPKFGMGLLHMPFIL